MMFYSRSDPMEDKKDYYRECLEESLSEHGVSATPEQIAAIASDIAGAYDNIGQAFYQPPASDQHNHEMRSIKRSHADALAEAEKIAGIWKAEACRLARVAPHRAYISHGDVYVQRN